MQGPGTNGDGRRDGIGVLLVISNLEYGGAQRQVVELANQLNDTDVAAHVCCLSDYVPLMAELRGADQCLHVVAKRAKFDVSVVPRLAKLVEHLRPSVVHSFLFDAEIAGRLAGRMAGSVAVVGSERNTDYARKLRHSVALRLTRRHFDAIIANSHAGKRFQMRTLGIPADRIFVVHNGVDVHAFTPAPACGLRTEFGIAPDEHVVAMFASFKKQKNHAMFFRMAARVLRSRPRTRFLCVGGELHRGLQGSGDYRMEMMNMIRRSGLSDAVLCIGNRDDVVSVYNLCDVTVLTSQREGTPNVLLESMACAVPVVATDVADNALVAPDGRVGYIVPYDDDAAMSDHVISLLSDDEARRSMGAEARRWVSREFSLKCLARKTAAVYRAVLQRRTARDTGFAAWCARDGSGSDSGGTSQRCT